MKATPKRSTSANTDTAESVRQESGTEVKRYSGAAADITKNIDAMREGAQSVMTPQESEASAEKPSPNISVAEEKREDTDKYSLSESERTDLFDDLRTSLSKKENHKDAPNFDVIKNALLKNPRMMFNLKKLQDAGAELVITTVQPGQYIEFANAAQNLKIYEQEKRLEELIIKRETNDAIETILAPLTAETQKALARDRLISELFRFDCLRGLKYERGCFNYVEALVYATAHGGTLISYEAYDTLAKEDSSVCEQGTYTWFLIHLSDLLKDHRALYGYRDSGKVYKKEERADFFYGPLGSRVAGLKLQIA